MEFVSKVPEIFNKAQEIYGDYNRGKQMRLGSYNGMSSVRQIGHYNKRGKRLAIYHGDSN